MNLYLNLQGGYKADLVMVLVPLQTLIPALVAVILVFREKGRFCEYGLTIGFIMVKI
jgi:hypothetical protein